MRWPESADHPAGVCPGSGADELIAIADELMAINDHTLNAPSVRVVVLPFSTLFDM